MNKRKWMGIGLIGGVFLLGIFVRSGINPFEKAFASVANGFTDPKIMVKSQLPILEFQKDRRGKLLEAFEENEDTDRPIKLEIDKSHISPVTPKGKGRVLIYHTHINEAYAQGGNYNYKETGSFRTDDKNKNVARVGEELADILRKDYGLTVVHDTGNYEPPKLGTAYSRSLDMLERRIKEDGEYDIYLDIHRDAYDTVPEDTLNVNGVSMARIMVVIGTGEGNKGKPILPRPDYKSNYAYGNQITDNLNKQINGLGKAVRVNKSRYNQHISKRAILIEMGYTGNNMEQVLAGVPYLAKAIGDTIQK